MALGEAKQIARPCEHCGGTFTPVTWCAKTCSDECRRQRKSAMGTEREKARSRQLTVAESLGARERNAVWAAAHRACEKQNPWLAGAPPYHTHLPGGAMTVAFDPLPRWPLELRNTPGLHGALTALGGVGHGARFPAFALIPWLSGWAVYWFRDECLDRANKRVSGALFDRPTQFAFGPLVRFRSPRVARRGRQRVRIDTITPIVIRSNGGATPCVRPAASNLVSAIGAEFLHRLAPSPEWDRYVAERIRMEMVRVDTQPATVRFGGKYGLVRGWEGSVIVEVNAVARWLLEVASRVGLGGRTAFGCGRIRITEVER